MLCKSLDTLLLAAAVLGLAVGAGAQVKAQEWTPCAVERGYCRLTRPGQVRFGLENKWIYREVKQGIACTNEAFGADPAKGLQKRCETESRAPLLPVPAELYQLSPSD